MCDPMTAIMGIVSIGAAFMQYQQQQEVMNMQQQANSQWVSWQRQQAALENERQERMRQRAEAARVEGLDKMTAEQQKKAQGEEEKRVEQQITPQDLPTEPEQIIGDKLLSGQQSMDPSVRAGIADQVSSAARDARARIAALATLQSYGPSEFSLQNRANDIFTKAGQEISLMGNERAGSLAAYGAAKQVQPRQIVATPSMWGGLAGGLASIAGKSAGFGMGGGGSF